MVMRVLAVFLIVAQTNFVNAAELATNWAEPSRTRRCPVHAPFSIATNQANSKVQFVPPRRGSFSLAETSISLQDASAGLRVTVSSVGAKMPSFWRFSLHHPSTGGRRRKVRFVATVEVPSGGVEKTLFMPWTSFGGQSLHIGGSSSCVGSTSSDCSFKPSKMTHLDILWSRKGGMEEPTLVLHELEAAQSATATVLVAPSVAAPVESKCSCDADCVRCMALSWTPMVTQSCESSTTADQCLTVRRSLAAHVVAGLGGINGSCSVPGAREAVQWLVSAMDVTTCIGANPALPAKLMGDVLQAVFSVALPEPTAACKDSGSLSLTSADDFLGPFVGEGITGYNDLGMTEGETASTCLEKCRAEPRCKSIDYGARDVVQGQCWLSTANRITAGHAYSNQWYLYDYYEQITASSDKQAANTGSMVKALSAERRSELLKGQMGKSDCCADPGACMQQAINAGVPLYNGGDHLGCAVVYHATASLLAECPVAASGQMPDAQGLMHATAKMAEMDAQPGHAAWRLRQAIDAYLTMLQSPQNDQCKKSAQIALSNTKAADVLTANPADVLTTNKLPQSTTNTRLQPAGTSTTRSPVPAGTVVLTTNPTDVLTTNKLPQSTTNTRSPSPSPDGSRRDPKFGPEGSSASGAMSSIGSSWYFQAHLPLSMLMFLAGLYY